MLLLCSFRFTIPFAVTSQIHGRPRTDSGNGAPSNDAIRDFYCRRNLHAMDRPLDLLGRVGARPQTVPLRAGSRKARTA